MALCLIDSSIDVNPRFQKGKSPTPCADLSSVFSFAALPTHKDSRSICCMLPEVSSLQSMLSGSSRSPASLLPWNQPSRTPVASLDSLQNPITFCPRLCLFPRPTPRQPRDPPLLQHAPLSDGLHSRPLPPVCTSSLHLTHTPSPTSSQEHIKTLVSQSAKLIMDNGGVVRKIESWGTMQLPQRMKKKRTNAYEYLGE